MRFAYLCYGWIYNNNNNCEIKVPSAFVPKNVTIDFTLIYKAKDSVKIDLYLIFKDIEANFYRQRFKSDKVASELFHRHDGMDVFKIFNIVSENPELINNYGL